MIGPIKALRIVIKNRDQIPKREFWKLDILLIFLGALHTFIFYKTAGRVFPDDMAPRLIMMALMVALLILTVIYVRCLKWIKKYSFQ